MKNPKIMDNEELLEVYHEYRDRMDGILNRGGMGTKEIRYMYDCHDELIERENQ